MPKYYAHKPQWKQRGASGGARSAAPPVLETSRSPSGEYSFSGQTYTPPVNRGGRSPVPRVPRGQGGTRYPSEERIMAAWQHMQQMKQLLAGGTAGAAMAALDMLSDPDTQDALANYGWDNFMKGDLPPPFDFLNPDENWMDRLNGGEPKPVMQQSPGKPDPTWSLPDGEGGFVSVQFPPGTALPFPSDALVNVVVLRHIAERPPHIAVWNPWFYGLPGGARGTADLLANLGVSDNFGWNYHEVFGPFNQSDIGASFTNGNTAKFVWKATVGQGATAAEAIEKASVPMVTVPSLDGWPARLVPVAVAPVYSPVWHSWALTPYANLLKQIAGVQVRDIPREDGWLGAEPGSKTIIPPRGPILTLPGEPVPHPPGPGTKEKKARVGSGLLEIAQGLFHQITEYGDAVDALFDAIPKEKRCKTKSLVGKSACIFLHLDDVDVGDAIVNLAWNQFEDYVIGKGLFAVNQKAAQARGDKYGFRTLNSMNGVGGLESLGELYGDFSQKYVNPRKEDLKAYLTERFGI